jgi:hypothetical protein
MSKNGKDVQGLMANVAAGRGTGRQKLTFDPTTGKLRVVNEDQATGDNVVCTDMAAAGFFIKSFTMDGTIRWLLDDKDDH